jgi:glucan phosphoethanolaminetransferase (alkaline phosphatase superfamily)
MGQFNIAFRVQTGFGVLLVLAALFTLSALAALTIVRLQDTLLLGLTVAASVALTMSNLAIFDIIGAIAVETRTEARNMVAMAFSIMAGVSAIAYFFLMQGYGGTDAATSFVILGVFCLLCYLTATGAIAWRYPRRLPGERTRRKGTCGQKTLETV